MDEQQPHIQVTNMIALSNNPPIIHPIIHRSTTSKSTLAHYPKVSEQKHFSQNPHPCISRLLDNVDNVDNSLVEYLDNGWIMVDNPRLCIVEVI